MGQESVPSHLDRIPLQNLPKPHDHISSNFADITITPLSGSNMIRALGTRELNEDLAVKSHPTVVAFSSLASTIFRFNLEIQPVEERNTKERDNMKGSGELGLRMNNFHVEMNSSLMHTMNIPNKFAKMFIGSMSKNIKLEGPSGYTWHVKIMRSANTFALQSGWKEFVTANKIDENDFIVFRYKDNSSFKVLIFDRSGCEKVAPFFAKNMNTESEKEIIYLSSTDTDESSCGVLTRAARARMTRERVCGKRKQRDFVQESTESESSSGKDNRCGIVQRKCTSMIPRETLVSLMPAGETSRPQKQKRGWKRVNPESVYTGKRAEGLPDGWVINERVRLSGKLAGYKYKYFIEPGTGNSFRSRKSVWHHLGLGLPDSKPSKNKHRKSLARGDFVQESTESESSSGKDNRCGIVQRKCTSMISRETLVSCMPAGETSRPQKQKGGQKRVSPESVYTGKRPEGLPDGWVINERVRLSGKQAGYKDKYFIEPGTLKSFRSLKSVWHHLGLPDSKPCNNKHRKSPARGVAKSLRRKSS